MTDGFGLPRIGVVCGAGIQPSGDLAQSAVIYDNIADCEGWPGTDNAKAETEIKFTVSMPQQSVWTAFVWTAAVITTGCQLAAAFDSDGR
jgi:hypothetical protein